MKKLLWISRHEMTSEQIMDLERALGDTLQVKQWKDTVHDIQEVMPLAMDADVVAVVLPTELLAELVKRLTGKMIVQSVAERTPTGRLKKLPDGREEQEFEFKHRYWQQVIKMELVTRKI